MSKPFQLGSLSITSSDIQYVQDENGHLALYLAEPYATVVTLERKSPQGIAFLTWLFPMLLNPPEAHV